MKIFYAVAFALMASPVMLRSQDIAGTVTDANTGEPLEGVEVLVENTPSTTVTRRNGEFSFGPLEPGTYTLRVASSLFEQSSRDVTVEAGRTSRVDIALAMGTIRLNKDLVVTAKRFPGEQFDTPEAVSVVGQTFLDDYAPAVVPDALVGTAGVWMQKTNYGGGSAFIRGLTGQQTLLMVDGIRLNNATYRFGPNQYLNTVEPFSIQRIEVVRGSGSVRHGSDALGGVVNLITKSPAFVSDGVHVSAEGFSRYVSHDMEKSVAGTLTVSGKNAAVSGSVAFRDFGDVRAGGGRTLEPTGYGQVAGDIKSVFRVGDHQRVTLAYQHMDQRDVPVYHKVVLEDFLINQFSLQRRQLGYGRWELFSDRKLLNKVQVTASWQRSDEGRESRKNGSSRQTDEFDRVDTYGLTALVQSRFSSRWEAVSGIEAYADQVSSERFDVSLPEGTRVAQRGLYPDGSTMNNIGLFTHHQYRVNRFIVSAGARFNYFEVAVNESTGGLGEFTLRPSALIGNAAVVYAVHPNHHLIASVNTGLRAPNIDDLGTLGIRDFRYEVPNRDLVPEESVSVEFGYKVQREQFSASASVFKNYLTNIITRVRSGTDSIQGYPVYLKQNSAEAYIQGVEAAFEWQPAGAWQVRGNVNYLYGENTSAGEPYRRIPPLYGMAGFTFRKPRYWVNVDYLAAARQTRLASGDVDDNRIPDGGTPGWQVLNVNAGIQLVDAVTVTAGVQNIFDEFYRTHGSGVDGYGRSFWVALRARVR